MTAKSCSTSLLVEAGGRLVEDEHPRVDVDRAGDRDHLLDGERVRATAAPTTSRSRLHARERLAGAPAHLPPLDAAELAGLAADEDVLGDREVRAEVHLLVDGADAAAAEPAAGCRTRTGAPSRVISPAVDLVDAGEHLDQGRLARAVLAHQGVDLAGEEPQVDVVERADARELLADALHLQDGLRWPRRAAVMVRRRLSSLATRRRRRRLDELGVRAVQPAGGLGVRVPLAGQRSVLAGRAGRPWPAPASKVGFLGLDALRDLSPALTFLARSISCVAEQRVALDDVVDLAVGQRLSCRP